MADRTCGVPGCERGTHYKRPYCRMHWDRVRKTGSTDAPQPKVTPPCSVEGCDRKSVCWGWCEKHYLRWKVHGTPTPVVPRLRMPIRERIEVFTDRSSQPGCWLWTGEIDSDGYGRVPTADAPSKMVHRSTYILRYGAIPTGMTVDHLCHRWDECVGGSSCLHRRCCNPDHLEAVTSGVNTRRGNGPAAKNARKVTCINGHPLIESNVYLAPGKTNRLCRSCRRDAGERYRRKSIGTVSARLR